MTRPQNRHFVAMNLPTTVPELLSRARAILTAMTDNHWLPDPTPSVATLSAAIDSLDNAHTETLSRTVGTVAARGAPHSALLAALRSYKGYVQGRGDADPDNAELIIASSGLSLRSPTTRAKAPFTVTQGAHSGSVILLVRATTKRASYEWAWSEDGGGTWNTAPATLAANTTITGLPIGKPLDFRFRVVTKAGVGDWSSPVTLIVK
jgi:hypothetical protein